MKICIASGKGGTGKTTIAVNLALSIGGNVQFADCDVEEPNAHIFLKPEIEKTETVGLPIPEIDIDKCSFCGKCQEICQFNALLVIKDNVLVFPELCHSCAGCWLVCPEQCIYQKKKDIGEVEEGKANGIDFVHGRLKIGGVLVPPLSINGLIPIRLSSSMRRREHPARSLKLLREVILLFWPQNRLHLVCMI